MSVISFLPLVILLAIGIAILVVEPRWSWPPWNVTPIEGLSLQATGLVALADLKTLLVFTAYNAGSSIFQSMWILPGLQSQQNVGAIYQGEKPRVASLKTCRISRVENPATIFYLHRISQMGKLVHVEVLPEALHPAKRRGKRWWRELFHAFENGLAVGPTLTVIAALLLFISRDWWGLVVLCLLLCVRFSNTLIIKRRVTEAWMGALDEELEHDGEQDDQIIFITLSRWVRIRGAAVDINAVTEGKWLRDMRATEDFADAINRLMVYVSAALTTNVTQLGSMIMVGLLMLSAGAMGLVNVTRRDVFGMRGRKLVISEPPKGYPSRRDLIEDLITQAGEDLWADELGMRKSNF